jgi:hypothetical protein
VMGSQTLLTTMAETLRPRVTSGVSKT